MPTILIQSVTFAPSGLTVSSAQMLSVIRTDTLAAPTGVTLPATMAPYSTSGLSFVFIDPVQSPEGGYNWTAQLTLSNNQIVSVPGNLPGCKCG